MRRDCQVRDVCHQNRDGFRASSSLLSLPLPASPSSLRCSFALSSISGASHNALSQLFRLSIAVNIRTIDTNTDTAIAIVNVQIATTSTLLARFNRSNHLDARG